MKYKYTRKELETTYQYLCPEIIEDLLATIPKEDKEIEVELQKQVMEAIKNTGWKLKGDIKIYTPSPLEDTNKKLLEGIEKIEEMNMATYKGNRDAAIEIMVESKINELIRNQNIILKAIKQIINYK